MATTPDSPQASQLVGSSQCRENALGFVHVPSVCHVRYSLPKMQQQCWYWLPKLQGDHDGNDGMSFQHSPSSFPFALVTSHLSHRQGAAFGMFI